MGIATPGRDAASGLQLAALLRWGCAAAIVLAVPLALGHLARLASGLDAWSIAPAAAGLVLGALAADWLTGLVHWACDTWGDESTPWLGRGLIHDFRAHHREPQAMLEHDWIEINREPGVAAALALGVLSLPAAMSILSDHPLVYGLFVAFFVYGGAANQLHCWAHDPSRPRFASALQRAGLILSPDAHARHHRAPNTRGYCISTGWLNPLLDAIRFWRLLERAIGRATGAVARRGEIAGRGV